MRESGWFYISDEKRRGPYVLDELVGHLCAFEDPRAVLVWNEELAEWLPSADVEGLARRLPPPVPAGSAAVSLEPEFQISHRMAPPDDTQRFVSQARREAEAAAAAAAAAAEQADQARRTLQYPDAPVGVGGWLLLLCIGLTTLNPLRSLWSFAGILDDALKPSGTGLQGWQLAEMGVEGLFVVWGIAAGVMLWQRNPDGIPFTRAFLWSYVAWAFVVALWQALSGLPPEVTGLRLGHAAAGFFPAAIWSIYLSRSRRVANTYGGRRLAWDLPPDAREDSTASAVP